MTAVDVFIHGRHAGVLTHRSASGDATEFRLAEAYLSDSARPVLGQIFEDDLHRVWRTSHRIPPWFGNLLPQGMLRELLARRAAVHPERELHLLAALGDDLPGAVTVATRPDADLARAPIAPPPRAPVPEAEALRFSLAGMQLKFSLVMGARGPTMPLRGQGGRWIAKLPDLRFDDVPRNEATMLTWAGLAGIEVPEHRLVPTDAIEGLPEETRDMRAGESLLLRRFDRTDSGKSVHIEDFAQVIGVAGDEEKYTAANYETVARIVLAVCGRAEVDVLIRRLVFMLLSGNADMHLKNWSLRYGDGRNATLAPAYDLVATRAFPGTNRDLALKLAKTRRFEEIDRASFRRLARKLALEEGPIIDLVDAASGRIREQWLAVRPELPSAQSRALDAHLASMRI